MTERDPVFSGRFRSPRCWWVRFFGYGVRLVPLEGHRPLFSERNGYRWSWHVPVVGVCIAGLRPPYGTY